MKSHRRTPYFLSVYDFSPDNSNYRNLGKSFLKEKIEKNHLFSHRIHRITVNFLPIFFFICGVFLNNHTVDHNDFLTDYCEPFLEAVR